jgi:hypothetical protein
VGSDLSYLASAARATFGPRRQLEG